jgi:hypothetical protein
MRDTKTPVRITFSSNGSFGLSNEDVLTDEEPSVD